MFLNELDSLDKKAKVSLLSPQELEYKNCLTTQLHRFLREEELYWLQRSKTTQIVKGDDNTKYFQLLANERYRKIRIFQLEQDERLIVGQDNLKTYTSEYYKNLFGEHDGNDFVIDESRRDDIPQITVTGNEILVEPFSEKEIREVVFQMKHNKTPGPDGFPAKFYQNF